MVKEWLERISMKAEEEDKMIKAIREEMPAIEDGQRWSNTRITGNTAERRKDGRKMGLGWKERRMEAGRRF